MAGAVAVDAGKYGDTAVRTRRIGRRDGRKDVVVQGISRDRVRADTRLTTLRISKELFLRLIKEFPTMAVSIMRELAHRLEATNNQLRTEHAELERLRRQTH